MERLRRRNPFQYQPDDTADSEKRILDEQEQEDTISRLRAQNAESDRQALLILKLVLALSAIGHLIMLLRTSNILLFLPQLVHVNMYLIITQNTNAQSWTFTYTAAFLAPTLAFFHFGGSLASVDPSIPDPIDHDIAWWAHLVTPMLVWLIRNSMDGIHKSTESIETLESMKYRALGA
ncbi:hypothetical protein CYLTODRAFT_454545 [Cylindrobasidium torrendii FP15055 ss-10]|uniref:Uncharacterized protein n=1 Tax=Cylindrobasidium torrendii FP15055 ss-10 TaxID=1314674 RepID=A0A0D7B9Y7_9AGAR|nr:hypothetical protein CYLTODRAFT_454545 [Cylindrobasidium torrendii FP15055 ss-10]